MKKDILKNLFAGISSVLILVMVLSNILQPKSTPSNFTYSELVQHVKDDAVKSIVIYHDHSVTGNLKNEKPFKSYLPMQDPRFLDALLSKNIIVKAEPPYRGVWLSIVMSWVPTVLHLGILIFFMRKATAAVGKGAFSFGGSKARSIEKGEIKVTFKDVAGIDEAKSEVTDLVEFLKNPKKVHKLGGRMPRGVLLGGEPGTGKTLLAKAVAGEANVPFFTISGSNFVEMFVGVGASRVRAMFEQAKKSAPCIIFIDEIDAVGRHRGAGMGGGHEEREQTLNQLLVEMDGFSDNESVIVMAATNRPDVLDKALLRPGRFDRQVLINLPDIQGRYQILQVHLKKVKFAESAVDPLILAKGTPGMSGADLQNMVNEAALQAARLNLETIDMAAFEKAKDKILMGAERPMLMSPEDKKVTAYHEAGHAIIGFHMIPKGHDPIHKVTIMPRGRALGVTMFLPDKDSYNYTKQRLEANLSSLFGGRIAEALIFGKEHITTGASNDIERATQLARNMVMQWGLSEKLGPLHYHDENESISGETKQSIEKEIRSIIDHCYQIAQKILEDNIDVLHNMAEALVQHETINAQQVETLMRRESLTIIEDPTVNSLSNTEEEQAIKDLDAVSTT